MDVITHYDLLIKENNDPFHDAPSLKKYMDTWDGEPFIEALRLDGSKAVLEIGIGTGRLAARTADHCKRLVGIDVSPLSIERAKENLKSFDNISFICDDFLLHSFEERFDVIYSSLTMMHFENKQLVLSKVSDLLNNGGVFCLSIDKNQADHIDMGTRRLKIYPDTPEYIEKLIKETDMTHIETLQTENAYILVSTKNTAP